MEEAAGWSSEVTAAWIGVFGALAGVVLTGVITWLTTRSAKDRGLLEGQIEALKAEIRARQKHEDEAVAWIVEATGEKTKFVKDELRNRTERTHGVRPTLSPARVRPKATQ